MKPWPAIVLAAFATVAGCSRNQMIDLQEDSIAAQRNYGHADDPEADLLSVKAGTTQQQVIDRFGLPVMVHTEGRSLCAPWNSCTYPRSSFIYRSVESSTCTIQFKEGLAEHASCEAFLQPVVLGPGDVDPRNGMTGHP